MMELLEHLSQLAGDPETSIYRKLYYANPEAYDEPIRSWEEFRLRFESKGLGELVPREAPTYIGAYLEEDQYFFPELMDEVALIVNVRYCPPFLHRLAFIKIVYVIRGSCYFLINGELTRMEEGAFCLVGPNVEQSVYSCGDEDLVVNLLMRFGTFAESFLGLLTEQGIMTDFLWRMLYNRTENGALYYPGPKEQALTEVVLELCGEITGSKKKSNLIRKSLLMVFYGQALRLHNQEFRVLERVKPAGKYRLPELIRLIQDHMDSVTLPLLAEWSGLSEGYISRYLHRETGCTFRFLLRDFRMKKAAEMLKNTDFSVDKIIETVGYTDKSRFYRNFSEGFGMTPVKYRKQNLSLS